MNAVTVIEPQSNVGAYRASTDAAGLCREIVVATASQIQGRHYVSVEGWQAIATAHGCVAAARDVERVDGGVRAIGEVRRMCDGTVISAAEGFVGEDEPTWFGGQVRGKTLPKRPDYAIRAMAQTRAMSRACRSAFAHVVVMMKAGLSTTPAEEVPHEGFDRETGEVIENKAQPKRTEPPFPAGPAKNVTGLKDHIRAVWRDVEACEDTDQLEALIATNEPWFKQCREALNDWWEGGKAKNGQPYEGLRHVIERRRADLAEIEQHTETYRNSPVAAG